MIKKIAENLKYKGEIGFYLACVVRSLWRYINSNYLDDKKYISRRFVSSHGYSMDWENPKTLNQKLQVLKFHYTEDIHAIVSDKYAVRNFIKERFGEDYLIPLIFETKKTSEIISQNLPDFPVIVKANHDAGSNYIIRDKNTVNWKKLRTDCRWWLSWNYYYTDRERQYRDIERRIMVEKLLLTKENKIPNDYKLNFINGKLEFVYVSIEREGGNFRNIYNSQWSVYDFKWGKRKKLNEIRRGEEIPPPRSWSNMLKMGQEIAKLFPYVRVDFYDVDGRLYFGEITLCHGGGFDMFDPLEIDLKMGIKLDLQRYLNL